MKIEITLHLPDESTIVLDLLEAESVYEELGRIFKKPCSVCTANLNSWKEKKA